MKPLFTLGQLVATPGALEGVMGALAESVLKVALDISEIRGVR